MQLFRKLLFILNILNLLQNEKEKKIRLFFQILQFEVGAHVRLRLAKGLKYHYLIHV